MRLEHYGAAPLLLDMNREYSQNPSWKPVGFWVSVQGEDDWPNWCIGEHYGSLDYASVIELDDNANILYLETPDAVVAFDKEYSVEPYPHASYINWERLANEYDGIIIAPYHWSLRLSTSIHWYYTWDVASGCIWNLSAIKSVQPFDFVDPRKEVLSIVGD